MSRVCIQIMNQFERKSHEYKAIKRYWKLIQQDSRRLSDKRFYRPTFRLHLTNKEILDKLLSYSEDLKHYYNLYRLLLFHFHNKEPEKFFGLIEDNLKQVHLLFHTIFKTFLKEKEKIVNALQLPYSKPNWKRLIISLNLSSAMPLIFGTSKTSKNGFLSL